MLEGVFDIWKRWAFVNEFTGLEVRELAQRVVFGLSDDLFQQAEGKFFADHGQSLQQGLLVRRQAVNVRGEDALHGGREVEICRGRACPAQQGRVASGKARPKLR